MVLPAAYLHKNNQLHMLAGWGLHVFYGRVSKGRLVSGMQPGAGAKSVHPNCLIKMYRMVKSATDSSLAVHRRTHVHVL